MEQRFVLLAGEVTHLVMQNTQGRLNKHAWRVEYWFNLFRRHR
jgi:hypothetical protein